MNLTDVIKVSIVKEVKYTLQDLYYTLVGSWEGGSTYWVGKATINHPTIPTKQEFNVIKEERTPMVDYAFDALLQGGSIHFIDDEGDEEGTITLETFKAGFDKFLATHSCIEPDGTVDAGMIDANDADYVLQLALWGKSVFS